jgi:predicted amidohydrolase YtcJ
MGNVGLQRTLAAYRDMRRHRPDNLRLRVEHATLAGPAQIEALASLGAVAVVQPGFVDTVGRRVGHMRFDDVAWMPFADLADAHTHVAQTWVAGRRRFDRDQRDVTATASRAPR